MAENEEKKEVIIREGEYKKEYQPLAVENFEEAGNDELFYGLSPKTKKEKGKVTSFFALKKVKALIIILLLAALSVVVYMNKDNLSFDNIGLFIKSTLMASEKGDGFPVEFDGSVVNVKNVASYDKKIAVLSDTNFSLINNSGKEVFSISHNFAKPILCESQNRYLIYDVGTTNYATVKADGSHEFLTSNEKITTASIAKNGTYMLITQPDDYSSSLSVFSSKNKIIYSYKFANSYANTVAINSTGKGAIVSAVGSQNGILCSKIYLFDFSKEEYLFVHESEDNMILDVGYLDNGNYYAVGDTALINLNKETYSTYSYNGKRLSAYSFSDTNLCISLTEYDGNGECVVSVFEKGLENLTVRIENTVEAVSSYGTTFCVLENNKLKSFFLNGEFICEVDALYDTKNIALYSETEAFLLGKKYIDKVIIK